MLYLSHRVRRTKGRGLEEDAMDIRTLTIDEALAYLDQETKRAESVAAKAEAILAGVQAFCYVEMRKNQRIAAACQRGR